MMLDAMDKYDNLSVYHGELAKRALDKKLNLLFATILDYPDLYKIPMYLLSAVKGELELFGKRYKIYYLGPRPSTRTLYRPSSTQKKHATSFKVVFYGERKPKEY